MEEWNEGNEKEDEEEKEIENEEEEKGEEELHAPVGVVAVLQHRHRVGVREGLARVADVEEGLVVVARQLRQAGYGLGPLVLLGVKTSKYTLLEK